MGRYTYMHDPPRAMLHQNEHIKNSKRYRHDNKKVTNQDCPSVIAQKGGPALITARLAGWLFRHVFSNRSGRDPDAQLEKKLIRNPLLTLQWVLAGHPADQTFEFLRDGGPAHSRLPPPEHPEALAVPANQGFRLNNGQRVFPVKKPR